MSEWRGKKSSGGGGGRSNMDHVHGYQFVEDNQALEIYKFIKASWSSINVH